MLTTPRTISFPTVLRAAAVTGFLVAAPLTLTACSSGSTAAPATSSTSSSASTSVVVSTSEAVVTTTDVVTDTTKITELTGVTRSIPATITPTTTAGPAGGGGTAGGPTMSGGGGDDHSGSTPNPCPDPATLGAVTPNYDPQYPINSINCAGEWAVGTYEADGKNQTTGIWRNTGGGWAYQDRAAICATADNLPDDLYAQACKGN